MLKELLNREVSRKQFLFIIAGALLSLGGIAKFFNSERLLQAGAASISVPSPGMTYGRKRRLGQ